jgi:hypothetical protein
MVEKDNLNRWKIQKTENIFDTKIKFFENVGILGEFLIK